MSTNEPLNLFQKVYHQHINNFVFFPLGDAYHFYQWMIANQYWSPQSEAFEDVGYWVKRGLIVTKFLYPNFTEKAGISTKTASRYLDKLVEQGFVAVLQEGGFVHKGRTKPFVVAVGSWRHRESDGMREPHYVGWMNALNGQNGQISFDELQVAIAATSEHGEKARAHIVRARAKWEADRRNIIAEEEEQTEAARQAILTDQGEGGDTSDNAGQTKTSGHGQTELFSHGQTKTSGETEIASTQKAITEKTHSVADKSAPVATLPKPTREPGEAHLAYATRLQEWSRQRSGKVGVGHPPVGLPGRVADERVEVEGKQLASKLEGSKVEATSTSSSATLQEQGDDSGNTGNRKSSSPECSAALPNGRLEKKRGRPKKEAAEKKPRARNPLFDAVAPYVAGSSSEKAIKASGSEIGKVSAYLKGLEITAEQVPVLAAYIQQECFVSPQPKISVGSWEKFTGTWISRQEGLSAPSRLETLRKNHVNTPPAETGAKSAPDGKDEFAW